MGCLNALLGTYWLNDVFWVSIMTLGTVLSIIIYSCCAIVVVSPILDLATGEDFGMLRWGLVALQMIALVIKICWVITVV